MFKLVKILNEIISEVGDLQGLEPFPISGTDTLSSFISDSGLKIDIEIEEVTIEDVKDELVIPQPLEKIMDYQRGKTTNDKIVNVLFTIEGDMHQQSRVSLKEYFRIIKTVSVFVENYIKRNKPLYVFIISSTKKAFIPDDKKYRYYLQIVSQNIPPGYSMMEIKRVMETGGDKGFVLYRDIKLQRKLEKQNNG